MATADQRTDQTLLESWARMGAAIMVARAFGRFPGLMDDFGCTIARPADTKPAAPPKKKPAARPAVKAAAPAKRRRIMPPEARKKLSRKTRARWRVVKANGGNKL